MIYDPESERLKPDGPPETGTRRISMIQSVNQVHKRQQRLLYIAIIFLLALIIIVGTLALYFGLNNRCYSEKLKYYERNKTTATDDRQEQEGDDELTTTTDPPKVNVRLPRDVLPEFYDLMLQVHLHGNNKSDFFYNGSVVIKIQCKRKTNSIIIHTHEILQVDQNAIKIQAMDGNHTPTGVDLKIKKISRDYPLQWHKILMEKPLVEGMYYQLTFEKFQAVIGDELKGFYLSSYQQNGKTMYLATSQLQPTDARRVFPCFDEPAFKAVFRITMIRKKPFHSLSNMALRKSVMLADDWVADEFNPSVKTSAYLLAFVVSQFDHLSEVDEKNRTFTVWARPDVIHTAKYALNIGQKVIKYFEQYFGVPYPLTKTDMIAVPDFHAGAMENWGLMIYREATMLWDPRYGTAATRQKVATVVSHEVAHQWFGNLVTLNWWDDLWLNEGFASFMESNGVHAVEPNWDIDQQILLTDYAKVLNLDSYDNSRPIFRDVYYPDEINNLFDGISYYKGASMLRMMESFMGRATFRLGLKKYLSKYKFQNAVNADLWNSMRDAMEEVGKDLDIKSIMETWLNQINYPLVTVQRLSETTFRFSQSHFVQSSGSVAKISSPYNFKWKIPITYGTASKRDWDRNEVIWLMNDSRTAKLYVPPGSWYVINVRQAGFYRAHYEDSNWDNLIKQLQVDHTDIPINARAQVLNDLYELANYGTVQHTRFLDATKYLPNEKSHIVWELVVRHFKALLNNLYLTSAHGLMESYVRDLVNPLFPMIDWTTLDESVDHKQHLLGGSLANIACHVGHHACVKKSIELFDKVISTNSSEGIPPTLRATVYCTAVRWGSRREWDYIWKALENKTQEDENTRMRSALPCSRDMNLLSSYFRELLEKSHINTEVPQHIFAITSNPIGYVLFWKEVQSIWSQWNASISDQTLTNERYLSILSDYPAATAYPQIQPSIKLEDIMGSRVSWNIKKNFKDLFYHLKTGKRKLDASLPAVTQWLEANVPDKDTLVW